MWVVTVDQNGKELGDGRWVDIPKPDSFSKNGFAHIESYVSKLTNSSARYSSLIIATPDGRIAVLLCQRGGGMEFSLSVEWRSEPEREQAVRQFFAEHNLSASLDYLAGNGGVPDATRCLSYPLPSDVQFVSSLTKDVLGQVYQMREQDALGFTYEENNRAS
jgi:hypothetical protein